MTKLIKPLKIFKTLLMLVLLTSMGYFGFKTYIEAKKYEVYTTEIATIGSTDGLASERIDEFTEIISLGLLKNETKIKLNKFQKLQEEAKKKKQKFLYYFLISLTMVILFTFTCTLRTAAMSLSLATLISLVYGLINPILMVTIHKELQYVGDVILSFESKGILGSIYKLYNNGELVVAITILLFSVVLPILKSTTLTFTLLFYKQKWTHKLVSFFKQIGKWSMIDVFVVAVLLVYLTTNGKGISHAEIQVGLYFFLIYVILSMITAILTQKLLNKVIEDPAKSPSLHPYDLKKL